MTMAELNLLVFAWQSALDLMEPAAREGRREANKLLGRSPDPGRPLWSSSKSIATLTYSAGIAQKSKIE